MCFFSFSSVSAHWPQLVGHLRSVLRIEPVLEVNLEALKHLFFDVLNVSELAPTSQITRCTLNFDDEFFHEPQFVAVFMPQMLFTNVRSLFLPVFGT